MAATQTNVPSAGGVGGASPTSESSSPNYEVIIEINYELVTNSDYPCKAIIHLFIEAEGDSLPFLLCSTAEWLLNDKMTGGWGHKREVDGKTYRYFYKHLSASDWSKLNEKINEEIKIIKETLTKVKEDNIEKMMTKPQDYRLILRI